MHWLLVLTLATFASTFAFDAFAQAQRTHNRSTRENGPRREGILLTGCNDDVAAGAPCDDAARTDIVLDTDFSTYVYCGDKSNVTFTLAQGDLDAGAVLTVDIWNCNPPQVPGTAWALVDPSTVMTEATLNTRPICVNMSTEFGGGPMNADVAALVDQLAISNFSMGYFAAKIACAGGVGCEGFVLEYSCWSPAP